MEHNQRRMSSLWMRRRRKRTFLGLNTTATADISFMLLAFFLMVSSMDADKGLSTLLAPKSQTTDVRHMDIPESNVLRLTIDAADTLRCNGAPMQYDQLKTNLKAFLADAPDKHIILISADDRATYDAYFNMQHTIAEAYLELRNALAQERYGHDYAACSDDERQTIDQRYPWRVSEAALVEEGGEQ